MKINSIAICPECSTVFNLINWEEAERWYYGHDCEAN